MKGGVHVTGRERKNATMKGDVHVTGREKERMGNIYIYINLYIHRKVDGPSPPITFFI